MKTIYHREEHFQGGNTTRDIVIGMSDGLTVPFALAAGISGAIAETHLVVTAGFAEIAAGLIAMGLGGYLLPEVTQSILKPKPNENSSRLSNKLRQKNKKFMIFCSIWCFQK